ncbi:hypothetical protein FA15DRAFT_254627 [Coprinopsis marcescibilis]|uniref:F-box domain-containing protein n=1 Tax=Coprinopsis marcescibilis TaxID=230819 RepID=A0A5C3KEB7_COPMA|nr:hypothetical protein FA15DRAFT_254627 [Coprinopsis marcescibilis]
MSLLNVLKRLPDIFKTLCRRNPMYSFLDLPDDIIYEIGYHLQVRSLCNLALTCRHLYASLLLPHLRRAGVDNPFSEIHLHGRKGGDALPALRLLIFHEPLKTLLWRAGDDARTLVREVEQLRRLVARIPTIEYMELDFSNNWPVTEFRYGHEHGYWAWIRVCTNLLHVIAQKCHFVVIINHYQVLSPWLTFIGGHPNNLDDRLMNRIKAEWRGQMGRVHLESPSKVSRSHPRDAHRQAFCPPFPAPPAQTTVGYRTTRLIVNDPGLFQRSLFGEWALNWVNTMPLTHLIIHQGRMRLPLLRQLRLPKLHYFAISRAYGLSATDVVQILQNNPSLSSLECLDTKLDASAAIIMVKRSKHGRTATDIGSSIRRLKGSPAFLNRILDLELAFQHLNTLVIQIRADNPYDHGSLTRLFKAVAMRSSICTLVFDLPNRSLEGGSGFCLKKWLSVAMGPHHGPGTQEAMENLKYIGNVRFQYHGVPSHPFLLDPHLDQAEIPDLSKLFAKWLSLFPALEGVLLSDLHDAAGCPSVAAEIRRQSPEVSVHIHTSMPTLSRNPALASTDASLRAIPHTEHTRSALTVER